MSDQRSPSEDPVEPLESDMPEAQDEAPKRDDSARDGAARNLDLPREYGGRKGPEPVRYGDWEKNGRCIDF